eukprot:jgi/Chlat1/6699/Chrsp5S06984
MLLSVLQACIVRRTSRVDGQSAVHVFNNILQDLGVTFQIKKQDKENGWKKVSLDGAVARKLLKLAHPSDASRQADLDLQPDPAYVDPTASVPWLDKFAPSKQWKTIWQLLHRVNIIGRANTPTPLEIKAFGPLARRFYRLCCMKFTESDCGSFYLHTVANHGGDYMRLLGSLGRYMNSGVEAHHRISTKSLLHSTFGGANGTRSGPRDNNGMRVAMFHNKRDKPDEKLVVMRRQSRLLHDQYSQHWVLPELLADTTMQRVVNETQATTSTTQRSKRRRRAVDN